MNIITSLVRSRFDIVSLARTGARLDRSLKSLAIPALAMVLALASCALPGAARSQALRAQAGAYELEVLVDGVPARTFLHAGETYILGHEGSRYVLRIHNRSGRRIEAVASVDGLDVIDGKAADFAHKRGYLVPAYGYVDVDGWRLSEREAAAFRFSPVSESYAAKTGSARNVGVIGVAVFPERVPRPIEPVYVPAPQYREPRHREESRASDAERFGAEDKGRASGSAAPPAAAPAPRASAEASESLAEARASAHERNDAEAPAASAPARRARSGLGTEFGEALSSEIRQVSFVRAHATRPAVLLGARYNDRAGLYAFGIDVDGDDDPSDLALRQSAQPFPGASRRYARPPTDWRRD